MFNMVYFTTSKEHRTMTLIEQDEELQRLKALYPTHVNKFYCRLFATTLKLVGLLHAEYFLVLR